MTMRTIVDLPDEQLNALAEVCKRDQISRAEAVRRAVAAYLETRRADDASSFGLWRGRADGLEYQRALRDEWDR